MQTGAASSGPKPEWFRYCDGCRFLRAAHVRITPPGGGWAGGLLPRELTMSNNQNANRGIDGPTPPNGVKAPGKNEDLLQDGPAQDSEIDDDDSIEDELDDDEDEEDA